MTPRSNGIVRRCGASREKSCGGNAARNRLNFPCSSRRATGDVPYGIGAGSCFQAATPRRLSQAEIAFTDSVLRSGYRSAGSMVHAKKRSKARYRHPTPCPAARPDGDEGGAPACLRCDKFHSRAPAKQRGRAKPRGWREPGCLRWRDKEKKALAVAVDCVGVIVRCVSSPLTSAEQALLIGGLLGRQPSWRAGWVSPRMVQPQLGGHSG